MIAYFLLLLSTVVTGAVSQCTSSECGSPCDVQPCVMEMMEKLEHQHQLLKEKIDGLEV